MRKIEDGLQRVGVVSRIATDALGALSTTIKREKSTLTCLHCESVFEGTISLDELGWHSLCPWCGCSFDVDVPTADEEKEEF